MTGTASRCAQRLLVDDEVSLEKAKHHDEHLNQVLAEAAVLDAAFLGARLSAAARRVAFSAAAVVAVKVSSTSIGFK